MKYIVTGGAGFIGANLVRKLVSFSDFEIFVIEKKNTNLWRIKEIADNFVNLERRIQNQIEGPMLETISTFAAFFKGIRTFFERLRS